MTFLITVFIGKRPICITPRTSNTVNKPDERRAADVLCFYQFHSSISKLVTCTEFSVYEHIKKRGYM
jgi:hypothetical protein